MVDPDLKPHHMKFWAPTSKQNEAWDLKVVTFTKTFFKEMTTLRSRSFTPL